MKHVNGFMLPHSKFLAAANACGVPVAKHLFKDIPKDVSPSDTLRGLAIFGCVGEIMLGPLNLFFPAIGVPLAISLHIFILSMTPFASVMEWNVLCIYLSVALFSSGSSESGFGGYSMAELRTGFAEMPALHQCLLPLLLFLIPVFGQLYPKLVPFLAAYRPHRNWRFSWHIVDAKAKHKLRKLRTLESIFVSENASFLMGSDSWYLEDFASGSMITFPHFRPLVPIVEWLEKRMGWKHSDDYLTLYNEIFLNAACGWCLGTGFYVKPGFHDALRETCGFEEGEMFAWSLSRTGCSIIQANGTSSIFVAQGKRSCMASADTASSRLSSLLPSPLPSSSTGISSRIFRKIFKWKKKKQSKIK